MIKPLLCVCLLLAGCKAKPAVQAAPARPQDEWVARPAGDAYRLMLKPGALTFCDAHGGERLDLATGSQTSTGQPCTPENEDREINGACEWTGVDADVRSPVGEADDIIDAGAMGFPMKGRVHDCAHDGPSVAAVTLSQTILIDMASGKSVLLTHGGGDRVAIGAGWVAWRTSDGNAIRVVRQSFAWSTMKVVVPGT